MVEKKRQIEKVFFRRNIHDRQNDVAYWLSQPPEARIAAVEELRSQYNQWRYGAQPRLERVYRVVKRK